MDFRRIPFQFTSTDPAKRQAELQKRFGLPPMSKEKMYVDLRNPTQMGSRKYESNSASSSPRLQHRVPIFTEDTSNATDSSLDAQPNNVDVGRKPRVRVVPIEIEGVDNSKRHRNSSGPPGYADSKHVNGHILPEEIIPCTKRPTVETAHGLASKPRVCNIPIKIEGNNQKAKESRPVKVLHEHKQNPLQSNGCKVSNASHKTVQKEASPEPDFSISLKKIEAVLEKLKVYEAEVEKFSGTAKEKQYRYLDEMLTRCMLDLDDVDTMGNENVRLSRKAAIKDVQYCIDLLESKISDSDSPEQSTKSIMETYNSNSITETLVQNSALGAKMEDAGRDYNNEMGKNESVGNINIHSTETLGDVEINKTSSGQESEIVDVEMEESTIMADLKDSDMLVEESVSSQLMEVDQENTTETEDVAVVNNSSNLTEKLSGELQNDPQNDIASSDDEESITIKETSLPPLEIEVTAGTVMPCGNEVSNETQSECDSIKNSSVVKECEIVNEVTSGNDAPLTIAEPSYIKVSDNVTNINCSIDGVKSTESVHVEQTVKSEDFES